MDISCTPAVPGSTSPFPAHRPPAHPTQSFLNPKTQAPRGVIDLDPYTDIEVDQATGAIVLGPGSDPAAARQGLRKFYLRPEDRPTAIAAAAASNGGSRGGRADDQGQNWVPRRGGGGEALGEWLSGFHRERYKVVRDERDAYMNLQVGCAVSIGWFVS